ncbi:MAG: hypothetical protein ACREOH_06175 [Candidatus Entotheonellia bacterium]
MTFWEISSLIGFGATVLGAWLTAAAYHNGRATRTLMRSFAEHFDHRHVETQEMMRQMHADTQATLARMDARWQDVDTRWQAIDARWREAWERMDARTERMDERADARHRETIEALRTLRA